MKNQHFISKRSRFLFSFEISYRVATGLLNMHNDFIFLNCRVLVKREQELHEN